MVQPERLVATPELARALSLAPQTIRNYRALGIIKPDKISNDGHARYDIERARQAIESCAADRKRNRRNGG
jgi:DNA-binding transcriptional MerR regulator